MKLSLRIIMAFCLTLMLNTLSFGASYSTAIGEPNVETVAKESFRSKAKQFVEKRIFKKVKNYFKDIKDTWNSYKEAKKPGTIGWATIFLLLATATLVVLKILEIIMWSWIWVFSPLWIFAALLILFFAVILLLLVTKKGE